MKAQSEGIVKPTNGAGIGALLGQVVAAQEKRRDLQVQVAAKMGLADYQHQLNLSRDTHRTINDIVANQAKAGVQHHFDTLYEGIKTQEVGKRASYQNELDTQLEQTKHLNNLAAIGHKEEQSRMTVAAKGEEERNTKSHGVSTDIEALKTMTEGLNSGEISPLVAEPGKLQNIGNRISQNHPLLQGKPMGEAKTEGEQATTQKRASKKATPPAPGTEQTTIPNTTTPDTSKQTTVAPAVVKPAKVKMKAANQ